MRKAVSCVLLAMLSACMGEAEDDATDVDQLAAVAGPLSGTPDPLLFPNAIVGDGACGSAGAKSCTYATATLKNSGSTTQRITAASATGPFWVTWGGTCNNTVNRKHVFAGQSCTLQFGFAPTTSNAASTGTGSITFASGLVLKIRLRGTSVSGLIATPDPLVFPNAIVGGTTCGSPGATACSYGIITITNNMSTTQTITSGSGDGPFWVTWGGTCNNTVNNKNIAPGASCTLQFGFAPTVPNATSTGTGTINFASGQVLNVGLRGTSVSGLTATPDPLVFPNATFGGTACGSSGGTACTYGMITITNNLSTTQTITSASGGGPFWVTWGGTCNNTVNNKNIAPGSSCTLQWGFAPTAAGTTVTGTGTVQFASGLNLTLGLKGTSN